jgi:hypothetical protein
MPPIAFYFDEHVQLALAEAMRARTVDILTTQEARNTGLDDIRQLAFATDNNSILSQSPLKYLLPSTCHLVTDFK